MKVKGSYNKTSIRASRYLLKSTRNIASRIWTRNVSTIGIRPYRIGNQVYIYCFLIFRGYLTVERPDSQFFTFRPQVGFSILYPVFIM